MPHHFTSIRTSLDRLLEAEYFLGRFVQSYDDEFRFELNAFLSAARAVTFALQAAMSEVPLFAEWYAGKQETMRADPAMRFFINLRNVSQKIGGVSYVGDGHSSRFVGKPEAVPAELQGANIAKACAEHVIKLANLLRDCSSTFPFASCAAKALTEQGMSAIGYSFRDVEALAGLPDNYAEVDIPAKEKLRLLSRDIEPLDTDQLNRVADGNLMFRGEPISLFNGGDDLLDDVAGIMGGNERLSNNPLMAMRVGILRRIAKIDGESKD